MDLEKSENYILFGYLLVVIFSTLFLVTRRKNHTYSECVEYVDRDIFVCSSSSGGLSLLGAIVGGTTGAVVGNSFGSENQRCHQEKESVCKEYKKMEKPNPYYLKIWD